MKWFRGSIIWPVIKPEPISPALPLGNLSALWAGRSYKLLWFNWHLHCAVDPNMLSLFLAALNNENNNT